MSTSYTYLLSPQWTGPMRLTAVLTALGIPVLSVEYDTTTGFTVHYGPGATAQQISQGNATAATFDPATYVTRTLFDLVTALNALTAAQKTNVSADLFGGSPPKFALDAGPNAGALLAIYYSTQTATLSTADKNTAKLYAAALYAQDNPAYLITPAFDPTINVPGWAAP